MQHMYHPKEAERVAEARMSFSARLLTERQFDDVMAITGILERRIEERGNFKDCLNDFSNAIARTERFDAVKADTIIRDLFKLRTGMSLNAMREAFLQKEKEQYDESGALRAPVREKAYQAALDAGNMVETGNKITFHRAVSFEAAQLATELTVTHAAAKKMMEQSFEEMDGRALREYGEELEEKFYRPQIEALKNERSTAKLQARNHQPSIT